MSLLWVDQYRPTSLDKLDYHKGLSTTLKRLAATPDFPHLLVYGPSGAGKKTRVMCVLRELFGSGVEKMKIDQRHFTTTTGKKIDITTLSSNYHIELSPADVGNNDRFIIQELIKEVAQTQQVDASASRRFKVVVLSDADALSLPAQHALRRTMEKYMSNLRIILLCTSTSKIISPIRSRCLLTRVAAPSTDDIMAVLNKVAVKEGLKLPAKLCETIAIQSKGNLRRAVLALESAKVMKYPFDENMKVPALDWEEYIQETAQLILNEQTPKTLNDTRMRLYELLTHCIPPSLILKTLSRDLCSNVDSSLHPEIAIMAAEYERRLRLGSKSIFHLEAFVARFMGRWKAFCMDMAF